MTPMESQLFLLYPLGIVKISIDILNRAGRGKTHVRARATRFMEVSHGIIFLTIALFWFIKRCIT